MSYSVNLILPELPALGCDVLTNLIVGSECFITKAFAGLPVLIPILLLLEDAPVADKLILIPAAVDVVTPALLAKTGQDAYFGYEYQLQDQNQRTHPFLIL